ncbi:pentatricopeptide repeat-containing protein [Corchorus olitorius]|uniref:Pentatricopeptide repeat-containing protein n=1 Tax=Corchorus olitorius TaxID=93759 RepID=A0A1R3GQ42_9ROSI|nr:pentatricopeptide repeat-containing protein [Corchorus olitorius]
MDFSRRPLSYSRRCKLHSGLVTEGCNLFHSLKWRFSIEPDLDHYTCMVDLLGRAGKLKEALATIMKMLPFPDSRIWGALLAASTVHGHRKLGEYAALRLLELEPDNVGYHTLLSNIRASDGQWSEVEEVRRAMFDKDLKKQPGWSFIEDNGHTHYFVCGDK